MKKITVPSYGEDKYYDRIALNHTRTKESPVAFFVLTFLLSVPFYILNALAYLNVVFEPKMGALYISLFTLTPITSASILTFRKSGPAGVKKLLWRIFDFRRIASSSWYIPILLLEPLVLLLSLGVVVLSGAPIPAALTPTVALPEVQAITPWGAVVTSSLVLVAAVIVTLLWGPGTLARFRFAN